MTYIPREGDVIKITARITGSLANVTDSPITQFTPQSIPLSELIEAGDVELVTCAEPDWQPGNIGQHIETGELFRYMPQHPPMSAPWVQINGYSAVGTRHASATLAGKLRRMRLVPEDDFNENGQRS